MCIIFLYSSTKIAGLSCYHTWTTDSDRVFNRKNLFYHKNTCVYNWLHINVKTWAANIFKVLPKGQKFSKATYGFLNTPKKQYSKLFLIWFVKFWILRLGICFWVDWSGEHNKGFEFANILRMTSQSKLIFWGHFYSCAFK